MGTRWLTLEEEVNGRYKLLEEDKEVVIPEWEENSGYCNPRRVKYTATDEDPSKTRDSASVKSYDSTPQRGANIMVTSFQGMLISPSARWFKLAPADSRYEDVPFVSDWLELVEQRVYKTFTESNFYEAINEFILDAVVIGTSCLLTEDDAEHGKLLFSSRHMREIFISESDGGIVDTVVREFWLQGRELMDRWEDKLPLEVATSIENNPYLKHRVIHFVGPAKDFDNEVDTNKEFVSIYFLPSHNNQIMEQGGYYDLPYQVFRWRKNSGELYGRSPAGDGIKDIKRLNIIAKSLAILDQTIGQPPTNSPEHLRGKGGSKLRPGFDNYYKEAGLKTEIIDMSRGHQPVKEEYEMMKQAVLEHFMVPFFLTFSQAQREMTATEVTERMSEKAAILSNVVGRLYQEAMNPLINRVIGVLQRSGQLPALPPELDKVIKEASPRVVMLGPLAQAQRRYHQTNGIREGLRTLGGFAQFAPQSLDNVDFDATVREALTADGWPQKGIKELPEVAKLREEKAKLMQQQMQQQQEQQAAATMKDMATAPQPGSPGEMVMQQAAGAAQQAGRT